ncbi:hypothetical protein [Mycoplasmopsis agassizii]|uniref:Lipoprotein n=1 Tax=Mycoplasmopsis agassizii TaxID=33922 RepID=A0ABX4H6P3_9BACT|nr:hypothetical protein [Mycoplasmopsis agassizii]PAF55438.1 hypothetical protein CJF60_02010 [Mycoplasmopsis agassizii]SMC18426.1 hypothetical protein SAMN02745179_00685 [Mycoplasmopsis agassizii]
MTIKSRIAFSLTITSLAAVTTLVACSTSTNQTKQDTSGSNVGSSTDSNKDLKERDMNDTTFNIYEEASLKTNTLKISSAANSVEQFILRNNLNSTPSGRLNHFLSHTNLGIRASQFANDIDVKIQKLTNTTLSAYLFNSKIKSKNFTFSFND